MYLNLLSLLSIVKCRMYYVETEGQLHKKVELFRSSPASIGKDYILSEIENNNIDVEHADSHETAENDNSYMDVKQKSPNKNNKHGKFTPKKKSHNKVEQRRRHKNNKLEKFTPNKKSHIDVKQKQRHKNNKKEKLTPKKKAHIDVGQKSPHKNHKHDQFDSKKKIHNDAEQKGPQNNKTHGKFMQKKKPHIENNSLQTGQDYSNVVNECSLKTQCSDESCMIQKDIPGCGGSIDLHCTNGCLNILKVRPLYHELQCWCVVLPGALHLQDQGVHAGAQ